MWAINKVLVPVDFSPSSEGALTLALDVAGRYGAQVTVLHAWQIPLLAPNAIIHETPEGPPLTLHQFVRTLAGRDLEALLARLGAEAGANKVSGRLENGDPASVILDVAAKEGFDLVVMGTHGRTGVTRMLVGSVAEKVVRHATCPVLTARRAP
jgi:nucleotide-binding universal stress UspA family protein